MHRDGIGNSKELVDGTIGLIQHDYFCYPCLAKFCLILGKGCVVDISTSTKRLFGMERLKRFNKLLCFLYIIVVLD